MQTERILERIARCLAQGGPPGQALGICLEGLTQTRTPALEMELLHLLNETPLIPLPQSWNRVLCDQLNSLLPEYAGCIQFVMPWLQSLIKAYLQARPGLSLPELVLYLSKKPVIENLLITGLKRGVITDTGLELLLCSWRREYLLNSDLRSQDPPQLLLALIQQAANNQYIWAIAADEQQALSLQSVDQHLIALAYHAPLSNEEIACLAPYPDLYQLLVQAPQQQNQLARRLREQAIRLPDDQALSEFYEPYPYPRWLAVDRLAIVGLAEHMAALFPLLETQQLPRPQRILIAGSGSGRQVLYYRQAEPDAQITALDLSVTSLAYGQLQAQKQGLDQKIDWRLEDLNRHQGESAYDLIEAVGVLHHLPDPEAGLSHLIRLLAPGALLKLAVYSHARQHWVNELRRLFSIPLQNNVDNLRLLRTQIQSSDSPDAQQILGFFDFYNASGLQDLFWNPRERFYQISDIQNWLETYPLKLIGFEFWDPQVYSRFEFYFPGVSQQSLSHWAEFEKREPKLFFPMLSFWLQKHV